MNSWCPARRILPLVLAAGLALAPGASWAKVAKGGSMGSLGSQTFTHNPNAAPIQRSYTPPPALTPVPPPAHVQSEQLAPPGSTSMAPPIQPPMAQGRGMFQSHPFVSGLMGGLVGAGIGSMLFGGGPFFGEGVGGFFGFALQILLLVFLARLALRFFRRNAPAPSGYARPELHLIEPSLGSRPAQPKQPLQFALTQGDLGTFESLLVSIQTAWSARDIGALGRFMTAEMVSYLAEQMRDEQVQGIANQVEQVQLLSGDVLQTWREGQVEYAQVKMHWSAIDYTLRLADHSVVEGDPRRPVEATEVWTMLRSPNTPWQLTAIQQVN